MAPKKRGFSSLGHGHRRNPNEASASVARKLWLLVELIRHGRVAFASYADLFRRDFRSFQRDLQQLRAIGRQQEFELSPIREREYVEILNFKRNGRAQAPENGTARLIGAMAAALGEPLRAELRAVTGDAVDDPFYAFAMPQLVEGTRVAKIALMLREAASSLAGRAIVEFKYHGQNDRLAGVRRVEPYRLLVRSGCFYLVAYDLKRRAWRNFALDRIEGMPRRVGTVQAERTIPPAYASRDAVGFMKNDRTARAVTVRVSPRVAASATARRWQDGQTVKFLLDGSAEITFVVADETEIVRWALGFGPEARIVAPPSAVKTAERIVAEIAAEYAPSV